MNKRVERYILWLNKRRIYRRRIISLILALSIFVGGNVFWFMRGIGTALADDTHEEEPDSGTNEVSVTDAVITYDEPADADEAYFEFAFPEPCGIYSSDMVNCAISQIGYEENVNGSTIYGDWYGNDTADWNVIFVSYLLNYAGISQEKIPYGSGCWAWQVKLEEENLLSDMTVLPGLGDILLIDSNSDGKCDHAGIIVDFTNGVMRTVEGDVEGKVDTCSYSCNDVTLFGYVSVNALNINEVVLPEDQDSPATVEFEDITGSGISVRVSAPENAFPEGVTMIAEDVADEEIIARAEGAIEDDKEIKGSIAVDITFTDKDGLEIEPADGISVDVSISFPEDLQLEAEDYRLFHIINSGAAEVEDAQVSQSVARFTSESFSIFVVTATGEKSKDKVHAWIGNANMGDLYDHREYDPVTGTYGDYIVNDSSFPYVLRVGDTITLTGHNENQTPKFIIETDNNNNNSYGHTNIVITSQPDATGDEVTCVIEAVGSTFWNETVRVRLEGTDEYFYIRVDEYNPNNFYLDLENAPTYTFDPQNIPTYYVPFGKTVTLAGYPNQDQWGTIFVDPDENPYGFVISTDLNIHTRYDGKSEAVFTIDRYREGADNAVILTQHMADGSWRKIRIVAINDGIIDHADIEIADGGIYTNVQIEGGENGELYKTVTQYQSFVYDVNYSELLDENGDTVPFYDSNADYAEIIPSRLIGGRDPDTNDYNDYWSDPDYIPGNSQYELTSKYTCPPGEDFNDGNARWSHKKFFYQDIRGAVFDVELQIIPRHIQKFIWYTGANGGAGGWVPVAGNDVEYDIKYDQGQYRVRTDGGAWSDYEDLKSTDNGGIVEYKNEVFNLGEQAVIDAYNKCPNHSGLDFTVHHDLMTVEFTATKELIGRSLQNGEFQFKIYSSLEDAVSTANPAPAGVASAINDADGKVVFSDVEFENVSGEHTYTYYMKEVKGDDDTVVYDPAIYKIVIDINKVYPGAGSEGQDLVVPVDISSFTRLKTGGDPSDDSDYLPADRFYFQNMVDSFKLPDTGGGGTAIYFVTGTVLIGGAAVMLSIRRRRDPEW